MYTIKNILNILLIVLFISCNTKSKEDNIVATKRIIKLGEYKVSVKLPDNVIIRSNSTDSVEYNMVKWLLDKDKIVNKTTWFNFDKFLFKKGTTTLINGSGNQLLNLSEILKAFPDTTIKLGSYTDNMEESTTEKRMKLSIDRATAIKKEIIKLGIDAKRIIQEGYGEQWPVASNATEEGRQQNRRIAIRVTHKL